MIQRLEVTFEADNHLRKDSFGNIDYNMIKNQLEILEDATELMMRNPVCLNAACKRWRIDDQVVIQERAFDGTVHTRATFQYEIEAKNRLSYTEAESMFHHAMGATYFENIELVSMDLQMETEFECEEEEPEL